MFFNTEGIKWTIIAILAVVVLCALDLHCSFARDRDSRERGEPAVGGVISRVESELAAGRREMAYQHEEQLNKQLLMLNTLARRLKESGKLEEFRKVQAAIQELQDAKKRLHKRTQTKGPDR